MPTFITAYLPIPLFVVRRIAARDASHAQILYIAFKVVFKTKLVGLDEADFVSGVRDLSTDDDEVARPPPRNVFERVWRCVKPFSSSV